LIASGNTNCAFKEIRPRRLEARPPLAVAPTTANFKD
jgi:hypothetical protein